MTEPQPVSTESPIVAPGVRHRLAHGGAVVAVETAVFTHGLPPDAAIPCFREICRAVEEEGACPAFCGVVAGQALVGMSEGDLDHVMAQNPRKCTPSTLPLALAGGQWAGTTAGATMLLAHRARIAVAATGGIGGVHRGARWDVSGDLVCLARLPMILVCSGAKAILDVPSTMEVLETAGVTVVGYRTDELPGFYTASTGFALPGRIDAPQEAVELWRAARTAGCTASIVVMNPPPSDRAFDASTVEEAVSRALECAPPGPLATPVLLASVQGILGPRAVQLNRALLAENARLAARISRALHHHSR